MPFEQLVEDWNLQISGVIHAGAHLAEEADVYQKVGVGHVWWIEGNPRVIGRIQERLSLFPGQEVIHALIAEIDGDERTFNITNYDGMSSSLLEFGTHPEFSPDTKFVERIRATTTTLDTLAERHRMQANFLNMDLQGAELLALRGAPYLVAAQIDYVLTEVNRAEVYVGCAKVDELDRHLDGFRRVATHWVGDQGWGDALYVRSSGRTQ